MSYYPYHRHERVRAIRAHMGVEVGDLGWVTVGTDYMPGWDAGVWTVEPDTFPEASPYGHKAVNYWTEHEMLQSWERIAEE